MPPDQQVKFIGTQLRQKQRQHISRVWNHHTESSHFHVKLFTVEFLKPSAFDIRPPPPPPPPSFGKASAARAGPTLPQIASKGPAGPFLVELNVYNGHPFKDHWAYFVRSHKEPSVGVLLHATGDVKNGFRFEIKRGLDFNATYTIPLARIPLQWVDGKCFNKAMFNNYVYVIDSVPVCQFERSASKTKAPEKSLNSATTKVRVSSVLQSCFWICINFLFFRTVVAFGLDILCVIYLILSKTNPYISRLSRERRSCNGIVRRGLLSLLINSLLMVCSKRRLGHTFMR